MSDMGDDGGPAFPRSDGGYSTTQEGMSLRDYFAGQVMIAILPIYAEDNEAGLGTEHLPGNCAIHAYRIADSMIAERKKS